MNNIPEYRKTIHDIDNPLGDGRCDRSKSANPLKKTVIPAGFVYYWDDDRGVVDVFRDDCTGVGARMAHIIALGSLRGALNSASVSYASEVLEAVCRAKDLDAHSVHQILIAAAKDKDTP